MRALAAGGGLLVMAPVPGAGGDYFGDLGHVYDLAPAFVVSLTTAAEFFEAGAAQLGQHIQDKGTRWVHLPIVDYGVPDNDFALAWPEVSSRLRRALFGGGRVLVHCKGGCGRTGMIALRLMIEAGEDPQEALARLRQVHPEAIETEEQMRWAMAAEQGATFAARPSDSAVRRAIGITNGPAAAPAKPAGLPPAAAGRRDL
ncbi:dual specificity protein phosphatase family protein [Cognatishimia sp. F0-27]|nr:dual specificity protein phosphatase family protein [Cognatishimia sp. F0-27]